MVRVVLMGPPGSGKGTCAHIISELYGYPVFTTGDMLREAVANDTESGRIARGYMERGDLVPDDIVNAIVRERFNKPDVRRGFILDGFPRSLPQAEALDEILEEQEVSLDAVLYVYLEDENIVGRLSLRRSCPECGAVYHLKTNPPKKDGVCDQCGASLVQRDDDMPNVIQNRLEVYREKTKPLLDRYEAGGKVKRLRGDIDLDELPGVLRELLG